MGGGPKTADLHKNAILWEERSIFCWLMFESRVGWNKSWNSLGLTRVVQDRVTDNEVRSQDRRWLGQVGQLVEGPAGVGCLRGSSGGGSRSVQPNKKRRS